MMSPEFLQLFISDVFAGDFVQIVAFITAFTIVAGLLAAFVEMVTNNQTSEIE